MNLKDFKVYNKNYSREEVSIRLNDLNEIFNLDSKGWTRKIKEDVTVMRAPEEWLVDLSDPYKVLFNQGPIINYAYFLFLNDLINRNVFEKYMNSLIKKSNFLNFEATLLKGKSLETEIRIAGSDSRISRFKNLMFFDFLNNHSTIFIKESQEVLGLTFTKPKMINIDSLVDDAKNFFSRIKNVYSINNVNKNYFSSEFILGLFRDVPVDFDIYVFVPNSCFRYVFGFVNDKPMLLDKILFIESHSYSNYYEFYSENKLQDKLDNKRILIIDNSYTGRTLNKLSYLLYNLNGKPFKLALFPKSIYAIKNTDYFLFNNKLFKTKELNLLNESKDILIDIYKKSII